MTYHRPRRAKVLTTPKEAAAAAADAASASAWAILQPGVGAVVLAGGLLLLLANTLSPVGGACNVSNVFGDHMVLQRAPQHAVIWGFAQPDTKVKVSTHRITDHTPFVFFSLSLSSLRHLYTHMHTHTTRKRHGWERSLLRALQMLLACGRLCYQPHRCRQ